MGFSARWFDFFKRDSVCSVRFGMFGAWTGVISLLHWVFGFRPLYSKQCLVWQSGLFIG